MDQLNNLRNLLKYPPPPSSTKYQDIDLSIDLEKLTDIFIILRMKVRKNKNFTLDTDYIKDIIPKLYNTYKPIIIYQNDYEINMIFYQQDGIHLFGGKKDKYKSIIPSFASVELTTTVITKLSTGFVVPNLVFECEYLTQCSSSKFIDDYLSTRKRITEDLILRNYCRKAKYSYHEYNEKSSEELKELLALKECDISNISGTVMKMDLITFRHKCGGYGRSYIKYIESIQKLK